MPASQREIMYTFAFRLTNSEVMAAQIAEKLKDAELESAYLKAVQMVGELQAPEKLAGSSKYHKRALSWIEDPLLRKKITEMIDSMPQKMKEAFVLRHQAEMSLATISAHIGCDYARTVHLATDAEKRLLELMGLPSSCEMPKIGGKPYFKAVMEA